MREIRLSLDDLQTILRSADLIDSEQAISEVRIEPSELIIKIVSDDDMDCPIIIPKPKGVVHPKDYQETHWERLELERRLGN